MTKNKTYSIGVIYAAGFLAYMAIYIVRLNFSVGAVAMEKSGLLTTSQIGIIGSVFSFVYAGAKVPGGYLGDIFPSRAVILCGLLIAAGANFLIGFSSSFGIIAILWGINAFGQSLLWGPLLRSFRENCEEKTYLKVSRTLGMSIPVGSIIGIALASFLTGRYGAAQAFLIPAAVVLLISLTVRVFLFSAPGHKEGKNVSFLSVLGATLKDTRFREIIFPSMAHGMIKDNITVWLALFFVNRYGVDIKNLAGYAFFVPLLTMLGKGSYLTLLKIFKNDYTVSIVSFLLCGVCSAVLCIPGLPVIPAVICLGLISALVAIINTHFLVAFPAEISGGKSFSFAASIMDLLTYGGAGIGSLIFGFIISKYDFSGMFLVWTAVSAVSAVVLHRMKKTAKGNAI